MYGRQRQSVERLRLSVVFLRGGWDEPVSYRLPFPLLSPVTGSEQEVLSKQ
jgi:hypothetical protein